LKLRFSVITATSKKSKEVDFRYGRDSNSLWQIVENRVEQQHDRVLYNVDEDISKTRGERTDSPVTLFVVRWRIVARLLAKGIVADIIKALVHFPRCAVKGFTADIPSFS